jgi:hypothetical protein
MKKMAVMPALFKLIVSAFTCSPLAGSIPAIANPVISDSQAPCKMLGKTVAPDLKSLAWLSVPAMIDAKPKRCSTKVILIASSITSY